MLKQTERESIESGHGRLQTRGLCIGKPICLGCLLFPNRSSAVEVKTAVLTNQVRWHSDYFEAYRVARDQHKMLFIYFCNNGVMQKAAGPADSARSDRLGSFRSPRTGEARWLRLVRLPMDASVSVDGKPTLLLSHPAFAELRRGPGLAMLDLAHPDASYYTFVGQPSVRLLLASITTSSPSMWRRCSILPAGTITQRTMVFAVRIHPERPASTLGEANPVLLRRGREPFALPGPNPSARAPTMGKPLSSDHQPPVGPRPIAPFRPCRPRSSRKAGRTRTWSIRASIASIAGVSRRVIGRKFMLSMSAMATIFSAATMVFGMPRGFLVISGLRHHSASISPGLPLGADFLDAAGLRDCATLA